MHMWRAHSKESGFVKDLTPQALDDCDEKKSLQILCRRFRFSPAEQGKIRRWLDWQKNAEPRPNFYFKWHLPRLLATIESVELALNACAAQKILDLATFAPFGILMEEHFAESHRQLDWTRTNLTGEGEVFQVSDNAVAVPMVPVNFNDQVLPFADEIFDLVLFTETLEHLQFHPHAVLIEINRVLRSGGCLVLTTPNVSSWKKVLLLSDGDWSFDSYTFSGEWGHRYEYSFYQVRELLRATGFERLSEMARDVYFDDPCGIAPAFELAALASAKVFAGKIRQAVKLIQRRGSGLFFVYQKVRSHADARTLETIAI